jgi:hypothetical protein
MIQDLIRDMLFLLVENALAINPLTDKLFAIGTDAKSGRLNLYIIDISLN